MANLISILNYLTVTSMISQWVAFSAVVKSVQSAVELSYMVILLSLLFVVLLKNRSQEKESIISTQPITAIATYVNPHSAGVF